MYRYTDKKNRQANAKFAAKQALVGKVQTRKSSKVGKTAARSGNKELSKKSAKVAKKAKLTQKIPRKSREELIPDWLIAGVAYAAGLVVVLVLLAAIYVVLMNSLLPQFFHVTHEKNILLVGSAINERAEKLYLIRLEPVTRAVEVKRLSGDLDVELIAKYRQYPLSSVAPLGYRYSEDVHEVKSLYNFALGQILDELYFVPDLAEIQTSQDLQAVLWDLQQDAFGRTTRLDRELLDDYFEVRAARYFGVREVTALEEIGVKTASLSRDKLLECPVALINAAEKNGLARRVSAMLEPYGVSVQRWETSGEVTDRTQIYYDQTNEDCLEVVKVLEESMPREIEKIPDGGELGRKHRVTAVIYLGAELAN